MVSEQIKNAFETVQALDLPEAYRLAAFSKLLEARVTGGEAVNRTTSNVVSATRGDSGDALDVLASGFASSRDDIAAVFAIVEGEPELNIHSRFVAQRKSDSTEEFAIVVSRARELLGLDTTDDPVRKALERHGRYDQTNFSKYVKAIEPNYVSYQRTGKRFALRNAGRERASELIKRYLGDS